MLRFYFLASIFLSSLFLFSFESFARFTYNLKPINPLVIPVSEGKSILIKEEIKNVKREFQLLTKIPEFQNIMPTNKTVSFKYKGKNDSDCFRSYYYVGKLKDYHIITLFENYGGSGVFSYVLKLLYDKETGQITLPNDGIISTGDRASGGIGIISYISGEKIFYDIDANASTLASTIGIVDENILNNLNFCQLCTIAKIRISYDINDGKKNIEQIRFYRQNDIKNILETGAYNNLLKRIIVNYTNKNVILEGKHLDSFIYVTLKSFEKKN